MKHTQPTAENLAAWKEWVAERPESIRKVCERFDPWTLYQLKTTGQRVYILSFSEPSADGKVTCRVGVSGEFNLLTFERDVFGVDPNDLEECDLPGPDELLGSLDLPVDGDGSDLCVDCVSRLWLLAGAPTPKFVEYKRNPIQMTNIVTSWPTETYGAVSLFDDAGNAPLRGWAEPSEIPGRPSVSLRANGESSWMSPEDARRLAAMLIAAANGINAFDPFSSKDDTISARDPKTESDRG